MKATTKQDRKTGQYFPAIQYDDGRIETHSPSSFEESRAQQIADQLLAKMQSSQKTIILRTQQCPKCLAYIQGDMPHMAALPIHFTAHTPDTEMELAESLNQPGVCEASGHLVETQPANRE